MNHPNKVFVHIYDIIFSAVLQMTTRQCQTTVLIDEDQCNCEWDYWCPSCSLSWRLAWTVDQDGAWCLNEKIWGPRGPPWAPLTLQTLQTPQTPQTLQTLQILQPPQTLQIPLQWLWYFDMGPPCFQATSSANSASSTNCTNYASSATVSLILWYHDILRQWYSVYRQWKVKTLKAITLKCLKCPKSFNESGNLKCHIRTHTGGNRL